MRWRRLSEVIKMLCHCKRCGSVYEADGANERKYCDHCSRHRKKEDEKPQEEHLTIEQIVKIAKQNGMSYGQCVQAYKF